MDEAQYATEDIDIAQFHEIAIAIDDRVEPSLREALSSVGEPVPQSSLYPNQPTGYRVADALVEILTPNRGPDSDEPRELPALGTHARQLRFLDYLIAEPMPAVPYRYGVLVNVPQPARFAIHKLIVATRRHPGAAAKTRKDIAQAETLIGVLADDQPDALYDAYAEAVDRSRQWAEAVRRGTKRMGRPSRDDLERTIREFE